jgi:hypothetical protein
MINTSDFRLNLEIKDRTIEGAGGPYMEWLQFRVQAAAPGFTVDVEWAAMPLELESFRKGLVQMRQMTTETKAELKGTEPGLQVTLRLESLGHIQGEYEISNSYRDPAGAILRGSFKLDQTYIKSLIARVEEVLAYPARKL